MTRIIDDKLFHDQVIVLGTHFSNDLGADSLDMQELLLAFEKEFDVELPDTDGEVNTVGALVSIIKEKLEKKNSKVEV